MITWLIWTTWTSLSAVQERPLNLITQSLSYHPPFLFVNHICDCFTCYFPITGVCWLVAIVGATVLSGWAIQTECLSETHLKPKSREISYAQNSLLSHQIVFKFCTEHGSVTAMLCVKFQNDWTTEAVEWTIEFSLDLNLRWVSDRNHNTFV